MNTAALLDAVVDQPTFLAFARALQADRERAATMERQAPAQPFGSEAGGWENTTIETFLAAAIAWAEDSRFGTSLGVPPSNPWRQFATFLNCGKYYE